MTPKSHPYRLIISILLIAAIVLSGCIGTVPETSGGSADEGTQPRAKLLSFERLDSECIDDTGMGANSTTFSADNGERLSINRTIKTNSPDVALNASLSQNESSAANWTLNVTTHVTDSDTKTCTGRIQYHAVVQIWNTSEYRVTFLNDGNWSGNVFSSKQGGGGSGVAYAPTPENTTTVQ
jgi:PBP1b-binding outer membrane lipoprotein LpoB